MRGCTIIGIIGHACFALVGLIVVVAFLQLLLIQFRWIYRLLDETLPPEPVEQRARVAGMKRL